MSIYISKIEKGERIQAFHIAENEWALPMLFIEFERWVKEESNQLEPGEWIADIGFSPRTSANGGGPIISKELMSSCVKIGLSIYLSEYSE